MQKLHVIGPRPGHGFRKAPRTWSYERRLAHVYDMAARRCDQMERPWFRMAETFDIFDGLMQGGRQEGWTLADAVGDIRESGWTREGERTMERRVHAYQAMCERLESAVGACRAAWPHSEEFF